MSEQHHKIVRNALVLGEVLRRWRATTDGSLRDIAASINISAATLWRVERGHAPDAKTLLKIMNYFLSVAK